MKEDCRMKTKQNTVRIRRAVPDDLNKIFILLQMMGEEVSLFPVDLPHALSNIKDVLHNGIVFVAEVDRVIVGSIGIVRTSFWYSKAIALKDTWMYIDPDFRNSSIALRLLRKAKEAAKELSLPLIVGVFSLDKTDRKNHLYRRLFTPIGEFFVTGV